MMLASPIYTNESSSSSGNFCKESQEVEYAAWLEWSRNRQRSIVRNLMLDYVDPRVEKHMYLYPKKPISGTRSQSEIVSATNNPPKASYAAASRATSERVEQDTSKYYCVDLDLSDEAIRQQKVIWDQIQREKMAKTKKVASLLETSCACVQDDDEDKKLPFRTKPKNDDNWKTLSKSTNNIRWNEETASAHQQKRMMRRSLNDARTRPLCESVRNDDKALRKKHMNDDKEKKPLDPMQGLQHLLSTQFYGRNVKFVFQDKIQEAVNCGMGYRTDCIGCGVELKCTKDVTLILCPECGTLARRDAITITPVTPKKLTWEDKARLNKAFR